MRLDGTGSCWPLVQVPDYGWVWVSRGPRSLHSCGKCLCGPPHTPVQEIDAGRGGPCCLQWLLRRVSMPFTRPPSSTQPRSSHPVASLNLSAGPVCSNPAVRPQEAPGGTAGKGCSAGSESCPKFGMQHCTTGSRGGKQWGKADKDLQ